MAVSGPAAAEPAGPVLETARLILRPPRLEDFDAWAACAADPAANQFLGGPQPRPVAWRAFVAMAGSWSLYGFAMFSAIEKHSGRWIGRLGPWRPDGWPGNEIGWGLAHEAEGRGYAFEGAVAAIDWAFATLGWDAIIHCIDPGNVRSEALACRLGSQRLRRAVLPPPTSTEITVWGQSRAEWRASAAQRAAGGLPR
jgi:RimJ/RimL family protein N-acetyltransferase